jgi:ABC-type transport system involved in multi-copper enzyme maturation permease subunit
MSNRIATIGRYTVLEALRTRLPLLTLVLIATLLGASFFVREIAITDSSRFQTAFYAAAVRFATAFLVALQVIGSVSRDFQDKGLDVTLALDLPRSHYLFGKLAGFVVIAAAVALAVGLPLVPLAGWEGAAIWTASLAFELALLVALSLFCAITFASLMPATSFVMAFYLLARAITAIRLIGANPIAGADAPSHQVMQQLVEALALVVPPLDQWTRTEWLVDAGASWGALPGVAAHSALLVVILTAAAVFDLHRRNF